MSKRTDAIAAAMAEEYDDDSRIESGAPSLSVLNGRLPEGMKPATAEERDAAWEVYEAAAPVATDDDDDAGIPSNTEANPPAGALPQQGEIVAEFEDAPDGEVTITLDSATANPVTVYINGRGVLTMRVGDTRTIPVEVREALDRSGATYTVKED